MLVNSPLLFFILGAFLVGVAIIFSHFLAPSTTKNPAKFEPYECGIPTTGKAWIQFSVGYYLFAIIYLIFDVETVFIFPWATVMKDIGIRGFVEILIFFVILGLGLLYAWRKKALRWE
jgi:NADH-quinone oxidoreductase subunit A